MSIDPSRVLFVGVGASAVCYYRIMLPAMALGSDWVGLHGDPPGKLMIDTGLIKKETEMPDFLSDDYDVVVLQQVVGEGWRDIIKQMQASGKKVLFEIDDYLHAIRHTVGHGGGSKYTQAYCAEIERSMEACDGLIVSTKWLRTKYRKFNKNVYVCQNGIDIARYDLEKPQRESINIGWAGAQGHFDAMVPWLQQVSAIMVENENVNFVSVGMNFADGFREWFPDERAVTVPWAAIEQYPAAMTLFDIALAPAGKTRFHRGKSDLRWVEAGALSIPVIADPTVYPNIREGETGFHAHTPEEVKDKLEMLIADREMRERVGQAARAYVEEHRTHVITAKDWERSFDRVLAT